MESWHVAELTWKDGTGRALDHRGGKGVPPVEMGDHKATGRTSGAPVGNKTECHKCTR